MNAAIPRFRMCVSTLEVHAESDTESNLVDPATEANAAVTGKERAPGHVRFEPEFAERPYERVALRLGVWTDWGARRVSNAVDDVRSEVFFGRPFARDVNAGTNVRMEKLVAEELVLLRDSKVRLADVQQRLRVR